MEQLTANSIGFMSMIEAGLNYSVNPASFLGCFLFLFFLVRLNKIYGYSAVMLGGCTLVSLFICQTFYHGGVFDFFAIFIPGFSVFWNALRGVTALLIFYIGVRLLVLLIRRSDSQTAPFLMQMCFAGLDATSRRVTFLRVFKSFFWGIFLAFFCASWPLENVMLYLFYKGQCGLAEDFFLKLFLFELTSVVPFIVILVLAARMFSDERFKSRVLGSRRIILAFSAFCVAGGLGAFLCCFMR